MSLKLYKGALGVFEFDVDDLTTPEVDDLSQVDWRLRIEAADGEKVGLDGTYAKPTVSVEVSAEVSGTMAPGLYRWYLIALQVDEDEIVAGTGVLLVRDYPPAAA